MSQFSSLSLSLSYSFFLPLFLSPAMLLKCQSMCKLSIVSPEEEKAREIGCEDAKTLMTLKSLRPAEHEYNDDRGKNEFKKKRTNTLRG